MSGYFLIAENIIFKNNKLTCINIHNELAAIAMPAEFKFDMAVICGPKWTTGEHKLTIKVRANGGEEIVLSESTVNILNEDFVYNAIANDVKFRMDYDVQNLTFTVFDNDQEVVSRKYPVIAMLYPQKMVQPAQEQQEDSKKDEQDNQSKEDNKAE
ncbi:MAG: hypothetical protein ACI37Z_06025 [Candidatus Gastranaerophilaceae bacterium]